MSARLAIVDFVNSYGAPPSPPQADPAGLFRPAPTGTSQRWKYSLLIMGVTLVMGVMPFLFDAAAPQRTNAAIAANEALLTDLETADRWPLQFGVLDECTAVPAILSEGHVELECEDIQVSVYGMGRVENNDEAIELGIKRSLRLLTTDKQVDDAVTVEEATGQLEEQAPGHLQTIGAQSVWATHPFRSDGLFQDPRFGLHSDGSEIALGFYRSGGASASSLGDLVVVDVVASDEKEAAAMADAILASATEVGGSDA